MNSRATIWTFRQKDVMNSMRTLRNEMLKYRKRKTISLHGMVAGIEFHRSRAEYVTGDIGSCGSPSIDYVRPPAQSYEPHPGFADWGEPEYDAHHPGGVFHHNTPGLRLDLPPLPERPSAVPDYEALPMTPELLERALEEIASQPEVEPVPLEQDVMANEVLHTPDTLDSMLAQPMGDPIQEIEAAIDDQMQQATPYVLHDDYLQVYEDQMQQMMDSYWGPGPPMQDPSDPQQQVYDEQMQQMQQMMGPFLMPGMGPGPMM